MQLLWPGNIWLLALVPVLVALYVLAQRRRRRYALRYASLSLVREAVGRGPGWRRHVPPALFLLALIAMLFALTRPQSVVALPADEGTVILAIDVSGSMLAEDLKPNRMEAAKDAARTFVEKQGPNVRIGIVSFASDASLVQAPTDDKEAVLAAISRLHTQRATAIGRAILKSLDAIFEGSDAELPSAAFASANPQGQQLGARTPAPTARAAVPPGRRVSYAAATIILLTDGENNQFPPPLAVVDQAVERGIKVFTIGVGSPEGTTLRIAGRSIRTRLDEATLKSIAEITDAKYFLASNAEELKEVYGNLTTQVVMRSQKTEITALVTGLAALLSLLAASLSLWWFGRVL